MLQSCASLDFGHSVYPDARMKSRGNISSLPDSRGSAENGDKVIESSHPQLGDRYVRDGYILPNNIQQQIVESGISLTKKNRLTVQGKDFAQDCTGTVLAAYWGAGLNPVKYFHLYSGNGVKRLHDMGEAYDLNYFSSLPNPGDVIIWDDTYDRDGNGKWGDPYTHAGVVVSVTEDGQITYLHYNYARGVVLEKMNLNRPDTYTDSNGNQVNSAMRMKSHRYIKPDSWLSSHLVRGFIPLYRYPEIER
ncbi:CHAP domain-containing protein [Salinispira pacifica]|nr:CHAP domain-containing protein [Salinispira pacifica]